jgi:hypothetical protein
LKWLVQHGASPDIPDRDGWGFLIFLVGAMLIYGAFTAAVRPLVLIVAGASKMAYITLVMRAGDRLLSPSATLSIVIDAGMVLIFAAYLLSRKRVAA